MKAKNILLLVFLFLNFSPETSTAQESVIMGDSQNNKTSLTSSTKKYQSTYRLETFGALASDGNTPFWMQHQKWGIVPLEAENYHLRAGTTYRQKINRNMSFELGIDLVTSSKQTNMSSFWLQQVYGKLNWKSLQMSIGMIENYRSVIVNPHLSMGDMAYSNNARPIPEIRLGLHQFTAIPYTNEALYIKADMSIGYFGDDSYLEKMAQATNQKYTSETLSHSKSLHFRIGNLERQEKGFQATFGADHYAQWGGAMHLEDGETFKSKNGFKEFINVFSFKSEAPNIQSSSGNIKKHSECTHFVSLNFKLDYGIDYGEETYSVYYQHPAENKFGLKFKNASDMLLGIQYKSQYKKAISGIVLEYLYTKNQAATLLEDEEIDHANNTLNNYYNSLAYLQGRSHYGMTLGSSIFLSPRFNDDGYIGFKSSRIIALHGGIEGYLTDQIKYSLLGTIGESLGTYLNPYTARQRGFASMANLTYIFGKIPGLSITCSGALNSGHFFASDAYGGAITIRKTGKLF